MLEKLHKHLIYCLCFSFISCWADMFWQKFYFIYFTRLSRLHQIVVTIYINRIFYICLNITVYRESFKTKPQRWFNKLMFFLRLQLFFLKVLRNVTFNYYWKNNSIRYVMFLQQVMWMVVGINETTPYCAQQLLAHLAFSWMRLLWFQE